MNLPAVRVIAAHWSKGSAAEMPRPLEDEQPEETGRWDSMLLAPLRWLGRGLSRLVRWAATPIARRLSAPLRWLGRRAGPGAKRGFGFWWLVATVAVAVALGLLVAFLLSPVAALLGLLVLAIWALVRQRKKRTTAPVAPAGEVS